MRARDHGQGLRGIDRQRDPAKRQLEQGFVLQQRAELFGRIVAQPAGQAAQAISLAAGENDRPSILRLRAQRARLTCAY